MNPAASQAELVKELHQDLARKYQLHARKVEEIWLSLGKVKRMEAIKAGSARGEVLKTREDRSLGNVYKVIPEWNLYDLTKPGSDLLDILRQRATKSLCEQYCEGVNGVPGDALFIMESMRVNNLRHSESFRYCFTMFMDEEKYGMSYRVTDARRYNETMVDLSVAVKAGACVPQSTGELILLRQMYLMQALNIVVEDILKIGSTSRQKESRSKKPDGGAAAALSKLSLDTNAEKLSFEDLNARVLDQASSLEEYVNLCRTEPTFLAHAVNMWFLVDLN
ncbi:hypothetical protein AJ79_01091 [Helicocarpus griseus UAMH5409]|uniref:Uncharacterized protein n=1 Tax=Helicocarpus griseus UAMH5409 TaxID=1447875 RepID=A0A2B7Y8W0_9EURO|nr:hypothetical protein AJ79_01091 [Helicocarpus griseus UAMH5409]